MKQVFTAMRIVLMLSVLTGLASADVPGIITHQGRLLDSLGNPVPDGLYPIKFQIYDDPSAGTIHWSSGIRQIEVVNGLFGYNLGDTVSIPDDLFLLETDLWLGVKVDVDAEMTPRAKLSSVGFAYQALRSDSAGYALAAGIAEIPDGSITNIDISDTANIAITKISGTAVDLISNQDIYGAKHFWDSTMKVNNLGVSLGTGNLPSELFLLRAERSYDTPNIRYGILSQIENSNSGNLHGVSASAICKAAAATGSAYGVQGTALSDQNSYGLWGWAAPTNAGRTSGNHYGVYGLARGGETAYGIYAVADSAETNWAGYFVGDVRVGGTLIKNGGSFRIDHPLYPESKYLQHSFVESPDMMNVYNGNVVTNEHGNATISLPEYFEVLNRDFRYQLTVIGVFAQAIVSSKIVGNQFSIKTDKSNVEVSWQVTGVRKDKWAEANRIEVEPEKPAHEVGYYINPEVHGQPLNKAIDREHLSELDSNAQVRSVRRQ